MSEPSEPRPPPPSTPPHRRAATPPARAGARPLRAPPCRVQIVWQLPVTPRPAPSPVMPDDDGTY